MKADLGAATPHTEAAGAIAAKPVVAREVFDSMVPEVRARAFTITGLAGADGLQAARDIRNRIATLPQGGDWNTIKKDIAGRLSPFFVDPTADAKKQAQQIRACNRRAELLLRTHGFQAYQATQWRMIQKQKDIFTHLKYMSMEDERVRPAHAALNGLIIPVDSPFWLTHFPPWDWGCRCQGVPMSTFAVEFERQNNPGKVIEGARLKLLEEQGRLDLGNGIQVDVRAPREKGKENAYSWDPGSLAMPLEDLRKRYAPEVWQKFEDFARKQDIGDGRSVWDWLNAGQPASAPAPTPAPAAMPAPEPAEATATARAPADAPAPAEESAPARAPADAPAPAEESVPAQPERSEAEIDRIASKIQDIQARVASGALRRMDALEMIMMFGFGREAAKRLLNR
jgi:SPP1 gp7 family putative phage head morphogenesis protein